MKFRLTLIIAPLALYACLALATPPASMPDCVDLNGTPTQPNSLDENGRVTEFQAPAVRIMRAKTDSPKGVVLIFPSGGYAVLSVIDDGTTKAEFWNELGYDAAILEYTIAGNSGNPTQATRDQAFEDALASVRLVREKAKELGLRGDGFVIMGGSAGGHLAARTVAELPEEARPSSLVLFYPAYLDEKAIGHNEFGMPLPAGKLPRLFVTIAVNDNPKWVAAAGAYADAWNKAPSGIATFKLFDDGFHGLHKGTRAAAEWPALLKAFDAGR